MKSDKKIKECELGSGLTVVVNDVTRHYFGGYYHVRLLVTAEVALSANWFESMAEHKDAIGCLGESVCFSRVLEKMAVPAGDVDMARQSLLESFDSNVLPYLSLADFPRRFVLTECSKRSALPSFYRS